MGFVFALSGATGVEFGFDGRVKGSPDFESTILLFYTQQLLMIHIDKVACLFVQRRVI
jgi:hypothetical protein